MLKMDKFVKDITKNEGNEFDAMLVIGIKEDAHKCIINVAGVDKLMVGMNAIALAAAMRDTLNTKLLTASKILDILQEKDMVGIKRKDYEHVPVEEPETEAEPVMEKADNPKDEDAAAAEIKEALTMLASYICDAIRG